MKKALLMAWTLLLAGALLVPLAASAQQGSDRPSELYQKVTRIDITVGDTIEATIDRPDAEIVQGRPGSLRESLIKIRENMREKVLASAKAL